MINFAALNTIGLTMGVPNSINILPVVQLNGKNEIRHNLKAIAATQICLAMVVYV
jgi:hypothetical protein